jgi:hypothetical protein
MRTLRAAKKRPQGRAALATYPSARTRRPWPQRSSWPLLAPGLPVNSPGVFFPALFSRLAGTSGALSFFFPLLRFSYLFCFFFVPLYEGVSPRPGDVRSSAAGVPTLSSRSSLVKG